MRLHLPQIFAKYGGLQVREDDCSYVWQIPSDKRCQWVQETDDCMSVTEIQYTHVLFCVFSPESTPLFILGLILYTIWLMYLFLILGTTADNFFCPALAVIAEVLHLSDSIAGVTILAFGNGAPDIFTSLVSEPNETILTFTELIGAGVFVTTIIAGSVAVTSPFRVKLRPFMRDSCFYILAICWIAFVVQDERVYLWEALSFIFIYITFIVAVVINQIFETREMALKQRIPSPQDTQLLQNYIANRDISSHPRLALRPRAVNLQAKVDLAIAQEIMNEKARGDSVSQNNEVDESIGEQVVLSSRPKGLFKEFFFDINPINIHDWKEASTAMRMLIIIRSPPMFVLQFLIPVVNQTAVKRGWSKLLNCLQLWITPLAAVFLMGVWSEKVGPVPLFVMPLFLGALVGVSVFLMTDLDLFAFFGFLMAMCIVYLTAKEILDVLVCMGFASGITSAMLGLTFLAWGNSVGDLISNVSVAKNGFPRMGYAACFGGPMFNTLLGLGLTFSVGAATSDDNSIQVRTSDLAPSCIAFLLCSLISSIIYLSVSGFIARRSYGFMLYTVYFLFMLTCFLSEIHFIHPLGSDHRPD